MKKIIDKLLKSTIKSLHNIVIEMRMVHGHEFFMEDYISSKLWLCNVGLELHYRFVRCN